MTQSTKATGVSVIDAIRTAEIEYLINLIPVGARVLEVGAGAGVQALHMSERGFDVAAIDIPGSNYADARVFPIVEYDGMSFPFADGVFDVVYTSNLLEHVIDLQAMHHEIRRVLVPDGKVLHVVPTHAWRLWTTLTEVAGFHRPKRHGERGNLATKFWYLHPRWWRRHFTSQGFRPIADGPVRLFYTGTALLGARFGMKRAVVPRPLVRERVSLVSPGG